MKRSLYAVGFCMSLALSAVQSQAEEEWSFLVHPPLAEQELSLSMDDAAEISEYSNVRICKVYEQSALADYLARYPDFAQFASKRHILMRWRAASTGQSMSNCFLSNIIDDTKIPLEDIDHLDPLFFCGNISRKPKNRREEIAVESYLFLLSLMRPFHSNPVEVVLNLEMMNSFARFDRRFRHYLLSMKQHDGEIEMYRLTWEESRQMLSPEERRIVEYAALRGDLDAVLKILPPCVGEPLQQDNSISTPASSFAGRVLTSEE